MAGIPTNRTAISLPTELAREVIQIARGQSAIMQLARRITLPGRGLSIPTITGDPEAEWVNETDAKPVKEAYIGMKVMQGYTMAVILPFSNQFRRDMASLYDAIVDRLPGALAQKFDQTVMGAVQAPGSNFDTFGSTRVVNINPAAGSGDTTYGGLVKADDSVADYGGMLNGFGLSAKGRSILLGTTDNDGRPLFINNVSEGAIPRLLGAPVVYGQGLYTVVEGDDEDQSIYGVAGDWTQAMYGIVEGVDISISDQASLTMTQNGQTVVVNLWERNMFAVRAEIEVGFVCNDLVFVRLGDYGTI